MQAADRLAIADAVKRYAHAWDSRDSEGYADCFTEDGEFAIFDRTGEEPQQLLRGRAELLAWAREVHGGDATEVQRRHHMSSTVFDALSQTEATTRTMLLAIRLAPGERPFVAATGIYHDQWRKEGGSWRIARRHAHFDRNVDRWADSAAEAETRVAG